jgi:large repetitive protein
VSVRPSQGICGPLTCHLGTIASGGSAKILVTATVSSTASGALSNRASVSGQEPDPDTANNRADVTVPITPRPQPDSDISVDETTDHGTANPGEEVTYTDTVTNHGPDPASGTTLTDTSSLPVEVVEATPSQGTCDPGQSTTCSLGTLDDGQSATVKLVVRVQQPGLQRHSVSVKSPSSDPVPNNNLDRTTTTIRSILRLSKTATVRTVSPGGTITFRLAATNPNSIAVHNLKLCDRLPRGLSYVSSSPKATLSNGRRCWHFDTLNAHESRVVKIVARALPGARGNLTNHATLTANGVRPARADRPVRVVPRPRVTG